MKLADVYVTLYPLLRAVSFDQPKVAALRQLRAGLDARAPGWRAVAAADPRLLKLLIVVRSKRRGESELVLWMRPEGDHR